jgi:pimeloyl-ACP methyl ester carboxylesterase
MKSITAKAANLSKTIGSLRKQGLRDPWLADLEIYQQAVLWIVEHDEFFQKESADWTEEALDRGMLRARLASQGEFPWMHSAGFPVAKGYRSRLDGSVQPYAITFPGTFGKDISQKWRVDVVLHGRDKTLNEVKFLHNFNGDKAAPKEQNFVRIDIYGRGNNAYRWAGEVDVFEVLDHFFASERQFGRERLLDQNRMVLRGFSMGGAGTWHLGLHWPDRWCVLGPGAGFTTTHGYIKNLPGKLPDYQEACLHIYDAVDYAENAFNVPVVAYSGAKDAQMQAAVNIENRLKELGIPMTHLIAPDLEHKFPPEWQKKAEALYAQHAAKGRPEYPPRVRFVTYTLRYPSCNWVEVLGLERHFARSEVDATKTDDGFTVKTTNIRALHLTLPDGPAQNVAINIDGQLLSARPVVTPNGNHNVYLQRKHGKWSSVLPQRIATDRAQRPQKISGLQGPIDDAFTDGFLCVRGTAKPWHEATQRYADGNLQRFQTEWAKYFRGQIAIRDDVDISNEDIAGKHLILFGDPASNSLIAQVLEGLPLQWSQGEITFAGKRYSAADHVPVMIYPSPLNAARYVVLNSGHTFHAADFQGTNALLYPRLGDYAVLKLAPTQRDPLAVEVATAGLFDDFWQLTGR